MSGRPGDNNNNNDGNETTGTYFPLAKSGRERKKVGKLDTLDFLAGRWHVVIVVALAPRRRDVRWQIKKRVQDENSSFQWQHQNQEQQQQQECNLCTTCILNVC